MKVEVRHRDGRRKMVRGSKKQVERTLARLKEQGFVEAPVPSGPLPVVPPPPASLTYKPKGGGKSKDKPQGDGEPEAEE